MKKITKIFLALVLAVFGTVGLVAPSFAKNSGMDCTDSLKNEIGETAYCAVCPCDDSVETEKGISNTIANILNFIVGTTGIIAVIFVIIGAITYITASGDPGKIKKGRDTIIYALIGLILAGLAFAITNAVITAINESDGTSSSESAEAEMQK